MADQGSGLTYFIVGMGVGVAVGMLLAPRSGEETRQILRAKADESADFVKSKTGDGKEFVLKRGAELRESASDLLDRGKEALARQKEQLATAGDAFKQAYRESVGGGSPAV